MQVPAGFREELQRRYGQDYDVRWCAEVGRWEFLVPSATGKPVSLFWGWFQNPLTGERIAPDPESGLVPFRDLDPDGQAAVFKSLDETYLGNPWDGAGTWAKHFENRRAYNAAHQQKSRWGRATQYADLIKEVDLRRPWVKHHVVNRHEQRREREIAAYKNDQRRALMRAAGIAA